MNKKEQELFIAFFEEIYEAEEALEFIKKQMSRCLGFNPALLFDLISGRQNQISIEQLQTYLTDRVACNERELYELFERMDWSRRGSISRNDFIREITLFGEPTPALGNSGTVTAQIQGHFLSLLTEYIKRFRIIEVSRKQVDFIAPYNAFDQIDYARSGVIGLGELQRFFRVNDFDISEAQLHLLLHGLRRRCYIHVNLEVFCENLDPTEFGQYEAYQRNIDQNEQAQFLKRSRREEETMRRSRIQSQKIQHNIAKQERRKRAELERELQLEERINKQIRSHQENKERHIRRAMLEEDKNIRWNVEVGTKALEQEALKNLVQSQRNQELSVIRDQENEINGVLARSAFRREEDLQASRRARLYQREIASRHQIDRQNELRRRQWISGIDQSRRRYQQQLIAERQRAQRIYQIDRIRSLQPTGSASKRNYYPQPSQSRRINELERQLQRTRMEMRERNGRIDYSKRVPETADRSFGYRT